MSRPSTLYPPNASTSSRTSSFNSGPSPSARLQAKQEELEGLKQLKEYSARLVKELERMGEGLEGVKKGGESVAQVMSSWQTVFRGIQVAQSSLGQQTAPSAGSAAEDEGERLSSLLPDTLVRIPVEQDHGQVSTTAGSGNHNATEGVEGSAEQ